MKRISRCVKYISGVICVTAALLTGVCRTVAYADYTRADYGGGYAVTGQIPKVGYTSRIYDAGSGLPTSDAMYILGASDGHVWIGGYSGVICYDGSIFEKLDTENGLTSARGLYEDSKGRIWVGTNDNGVVVIDGSDRIWLTYREGLPSSSIRQFAEDKEGNIFIGTTAGVCYVDSDFRVHPVLHARLNEERVLRLDADSSGVIYGQTSNGIVFSIRDRVVSEIYDSKELNIEKATTILADPLLKGKVYIGTDSGTIYHGKFGDKAENMDAVTVPGMGAIHWLNYDCYRLWVSSTSRIAYLNTASVPVYVDEIPMDSGIEMVTTDYQGNIWVASSTMGVMKIVTNNFVDLSAAAGLEAEVTNAVCLFRDNIYIGTNNGLRIIDKNGKTLENALTEYMEDTQIRCISSDDEGNLWIAGFSNNKGLVCCSPEGTITAYTTEEGMPSNEIRCMAEASDGSILAGTNGGLAVIKDRRVIRTVGSEQGIKNTVILSVAEQQAGVILMGTDGDGIYRVEGEEISHIGRNYGLTSDVIMKIIRDTDRDVCWLVTSNSIQTMQNKRIRTIRSFPYNNNYDIFFNDEGDAWVLSSYGLYTLPADDLLNDSVSDYRVYTVNSGLPYAVTSNSFSMRDGNGNLFISGRNGVIRVNINNYYEARAEVRTAVNSLYCDNEPILPDGNGIYRIPATEGRIQITASVMDYTMSDPTVHLYLEGYGDNGITVQRSEPLTLEYTALPYGDYKLHIEVTDNAGRIISDDSYSITKTPRIMELTVTRLLIAVMIVLLAGFAVWIHAFNHYKQSV